ncbi:MAG: fatty acid desaturase [Chloroflexi bacterium]|nr:MAG: fatty acid desaturase [Chloroflexota bacterium]
MVTQKFKWQGIVSKYAYPETWRSLWQIFNSIVPFFLMWYLMYRSLEVGYWLTLILAVPTAGFMTRSFIIFHDCCHASFFRSVKANDRLGLFLGVFLLTPYYSWKHDHAVHHATAGDLDRRGVGDVYTMTVAEYLAAPWYRKVGYRVMRSPMVMFTVGSFLVFTVTHRFWRSSAGKRERSSVIWTDLAIAAVIGLIVLAIGWRAFLLVQVPMLLIATAAGVWLFYVQHNFYPTYWERHPNWDFFTSAMRGSSYYKLPRLLQWFSGNIGFHHIHHLGPKIPNYKLEQCYKENPVLQVEPLTIRKSLKSLFYRLWDEKEKMLVGWDALKKYQPQTVKAE